MVPSRAYMAYARRPRLNTMATSKIAAGYPRTISSQSVPGVSRGHGHFV
jgi:hypothetical protein